MQSFKINHNNQTKAQSGSNEDHESSRDTIAIENGFDKFNVTGSTEMNVENKVTAAGATELVGPHGGFDFRSMSEINPYEFA